MRMHQELDRAPKSASIEEVFCNMAGPGFWGKVED